MRALPIAVVLGLVSLSACAHHRSEPSDDDKAEARVNQWIGHDIFEVIRDWGKPTIELRQGAGKVYKWRWGKPERFSTRREDSKGAWVDKTTRWTPAGAIVAKSTGWMAECRESFDVDARGRVIDAHTDGDCPPTSSMILETSESGSDGLGVGEL